MKDSSIRFPPQTSCDFACGSDSQDVLHALTKLAPDCNKCTGKRLYFCIEACCVSSEPFCLSCEEDLHFLHRKNELRMLFINRKSIPTFNQNKRQLLVELKEYIEERKKGIESWVLNSLQEIMRDQQIIKQKQERIAITQASADYGVKLIASCERLLLNIRLSECRMSPDWLDIMYKLVQKAVDGQRISIQEKLEFNQAFLNVNLYEPHLEESIQSFNLLEAPGGWDELALSRLQNVYWVNGDIIDMVRQFGKKATLDSLIKETNIEKYISQKDRPLYWLTTDSVNRSRIIHQNYQNSKASRLLLVGNPREIAYLQSLKRSTITELCYDHTSIVINELPSRLKSLTISVNIKDIPNLPEKLQVLKLMIIQKPQQGLEILVTEKLQHLNCLRYFAVNTRHLTPQQIKEIVRYAIRKNLQMLVLLKIQIDLCQFTARKVQTIFTHSYPNLQKHQIMYRRKLLQAMVLQKSIFAFNSRIKQQILETAKSKQQYRIDREEDGLSSMTSSMFSTRSFI